MTVDKNSGTTLTEKRWKTTSEKGNFALFLVLTENESGKEVLEKPVIGIISYRWGVITSWLLGIGLAIAGIIGIIKKGKKKK